MSNYEAHTSNPNAKYCARSCTHHFEPALLSQQSRDSFVKFVFATHFPTFQGSGNVLGSPLLYIILEHLLLSRFFGAPCSTHRASAHQHPLVPFPFVFSAGTAYLRFASHQHSQVLCISHGCCDVNMSLKI